MENREKAARMGEAARLVAEIIPTLDSDVDVCDHCGFRHWSNWTEHQAVTELEALVRKLKRWEGRWLRPGDAAH